jgi:L-arabinose transport system ATP-binding protein
MTDPGACYLEFRGVSKSFPGVRALDDVTFGVPEGSVHALVGENGAGKSTLLKVLSGVYRPEAGTLLVGGRPQAFHCAADAIRARVAVIYQELHLVPQLSVAENLYLGHLPSRLGWVRGRRLHEDARARLAAIGEEISPRAKVGALSIGQRQMVEIAKALTRDAKVIAFDEPTSSLSSREVDRLFDVIRRLRDDGRVILYVSHRLEEIFGVCDAATVLRDGRHIQTFAPLEGLSRDTLVRAMVGRSISDVFHHEPRPRGAVALEVDGLTGRGLARPASFAVREGEIVGLFGLVGAGRTELVKLLYGAERPTAGTVKVLGRPVRIRRPADAIRAGLVACPEDRKKEGIIPIRSVMENLNLGRRRHFSTLGFLINESRERASARRQVEQLAIKTPSLAQRIMNLSGGNQQKVVLARWLGGQVKVLLLDEPTRGIDVGAKSEIYAIIYDLARRGVAVLVVSSELPEVLGIADRILVMREGVIAGSLDRAEATAEKVLSLALPASSEPRFEASA